MSSFVLPLTYQRQFVWQQCDTTVPVEEEIK